MRIINAQNLRGCDDQPQKDCTRLCKVIADIPEGSPPDTVWIQQVNSDKADHVIVSIGAVTLNNLMIRGGGGNWWDKAGPSIEVFMRNSTTTGALSELCKRLCSLSYVYFYLHSFIFKLILFMSYVIFTPRLDVHYVGQRPSHAPGYAPLIHGGREVGWERDAARRAP